MSTKRSPMVTFMPPIKDGSTCEQNKDMVNKNVKVIIAEYSSPWGVIVIQELNPNCHSH